MFITSNSEEHTIHFTLSLTIQICIDEKTEVRHSENWRKWKYDKMTLYRATKNSPQKLWKRKEIASNKTRQNENYFLGQEWKRKGLNENSFWYFFFKNFSRKNHENSSQILEEVFLCTVLYIIWKTHWRQLKENGQCTCEKLLWIKNYVQKNVTNAVHICIP